MALARSQATRGPLLAGPRDQLGGTWKNPRRFEGEGGFFDGSSDRLTDMLRGRDISNAA